ncbi:hypothetical protein [Lachnospira multipara]|jgi:hypothetical protein|uniref:hypothetical protein n=1 Tax=Lachnospira multipara TaxID=28051 RepID=UPI000A597FA3|nr:hypothetical protein [Lachnospira multipara]
MNGKELTLRVERISSGLSYCAYLDNKKVLSASSMEELIKKMNSECSDIYSSYSLF